MKNMGNLLGKAWLLCLITLMGWQNISAQINIQVRVIPPYQSRISEYLSKPELMLLTLVNQSSSTQHIQLTASLKGDNGVSAWLKPGYKSPSPMTIAPGQALNLNALDIAFFFDPQSVEYTGISRSDVTRGVGLLEGTYQFCIQALDYETMQALSPSEPMGCTFFTISSVEPPRILSPLHEQEIQYTGAQPVFPISWSTPPGSSPLTEYRVRMVEILADRDPNDAVLSAIGPVFFEDIVHTNTLLYGPAHPQLTPGRRYALMVQAVDPYQSISFRNQGKSEVISFTYAGEGTIAVAADLESDQRLDDIEGREGATNAVAGRLLWAFKMDEDAYQFRPHIPAPLIAAQIPSSAYNGLAQHYVGHSPLQVINAPALAQQDPTMQALSLIPFIPTVQSNFPEINAHSPIPAHQLISANTATSVQYAFESTRAEPAPTHHPLAGATVMIRGEHAVNNPEPRMEAPTSTLSLNQGETSRDQNRGSTSPRAGRGNTVPVIGGKSKTTTEQDQINTGIRTPNKLPGFSLSNSLDPAGTTSNTRTSSPTTNPSPEISEENTPTGGELMTTLLASGTSDADGYFSLDFLHPEYEGKNPYSKLLVTVEQEGFEPFEKELPLDALDDPDLVNLGNLVLMAKNYRMNVQIGAPGQADQLPLYDTKVTWLRKASEVHARPHLLHEGNIAPENKREIVLDGMTYIAVSEQGIAPSQSSSGQLTAGTGRLFYEGEMTLYIKSDAPAFEDHKTQIRITEPALKPDQTMLAITNYDLELTKAGLGGEVMLRAGQNLSPVPHAVIHVEYNIDDVVFESPTIYTNTTVTQQFSQFAQDFNLPAIPTNQVLAGGGPLIFDGANYHSAVQSPSGIPGHWSGSTSAGSSVKTSKIVTTTDSLGRYYVDDLPKLREGASFTVRLSSVPKAYERLPVEPEEKSFVFLGEQGSQTLKDFHILAQSYAVTGRIINEKDEIIPYARLNFKGSSHIFESDETGQFHTTYHKGVHVLEVNKDGYLPFEIEVEIGKESSTFIPIFGQHSMGILPESVNWGGNSPTSFAQPPSGAIQALQNLPPSTEVSVNAENLGDVGPLIRRMGKVEFFVVDQDTQTPLPGIEIQLLDTTHVTNDQGRWLYEGYGGTFTVTFRPKDSSPYYAIERSIYIEEDGEVSHAEIHMEKGVRVHGKVSSGPQALADASVSIEGSDLHRTKSDESGNYTLFLPPGEQNLRAAKTGYFSKTENKILGADEELTLDFHLDSGDGKNISQLLGFDIELDKAVADSTGEKWSGKFVNLRPGAEFFAGYQSYELPFANVKVTFDAYGNAIPENYTVETDAKALKIKLFQYLPVILIDHESKNNTIKVTQNELGIGSIRGGLLFDFKEITGRRRFKFDPADSLFVSLQEHVVLEDQGIEFFRSEPGSVATEVAFRLLKAQNDTVSVELFGFEIGLDLTQTRITRAGLEMAGQIKTPQLGPISSASFNVKTLQINPDFEVTDLQIETSDLSKLGIDQLHAEVTGVTLNEDGFKLAGSIYTDFGYSVPSQINFDQLRFSLESLYGGVFIIPEEGIDIFSLAKFTTGVDPLSFGRIGETDVYHLAGNGLLELKRLVKQQIQIQSFMVRSDGRFNVVVEKEYKASIGFADIHIQSVGLGYEEVPHLALNGQINVNVPMLEVEAANFRFYPTSNGLIRVEADTIGARINAPIVDVGLKLSVLENGLAGSGAFAIPGTDIRAGVGFHFNKDDQGIDMGARFQVGASIVLGSAEISNLGGGFTYASATRKFNVSIQGDVSVTGLSAAVSLKPVVLSVSDGPVIEGTADVVVADKFETAKASLTLDFREKYFAVTVDAKLSPIEGVVESTINGLLRLKWVKEDTYLFLGVQTKIQLASLLNAHGRYILAVNIKNPKYRNDDLKEWFVHLDDHSYGKGSNTVFSGVLLQAYKEVGIPKAQAKGIDLVLLKGKAWFHSKSEILLIFNFAEMDYLMQMKGQLSAGGEACAFKMCLSAEFTACYNFAGGYNHNQGWFLNGNAAGNFEVQVGCNAKCNKWGYVDLWITDFPCGGRICANAHVSFNVSTKGRNSFNIHAGWNSNGNLCVQ